MGFVDRLARAYAKLQRHFDNWDEVDVINAYKAGYRAAQEQSKRELSSLYETP